jgi:hypothetical protein
MNSEDENAPLPPDVQAFFDAERTRPPLSPAEVRALREATEAALRREAPPAGPTRRAPGVAVGLAVGVALGLALGAGGTLALRPVPAPRVLRVVETRVEVREVRVMPDAGPRGVEVPAPWSDAPAPRSGAPAPWSDAPAPSVDARPRPTAGDALAREQLLLQRARSALLRHDGAAALEGLRLHAGQYPVGALIEEREALRVEALMRLQRTGEARARAADFHRRRPDSLLADMVDQALSGGAPTD